MNNNTNTLDESREQWGTRLGFMLAAAGSAVGLGNIWRFPFVVGEGGGAAFVLLYLLFVFIIGLPLMIGEITIGRKGRSNTMDSYKVISPHTKWYVNGLIGVLINFMILAFYSVIAGWAFYYFLLALTGQIITTENNYETMFAELISHPVMPIVTQVLLMTVVALIVIGGVKKGIEKWNNILMPTLFVLLIILVFRSVTLEGAHEGLRFFLQPDFSVINSSIILAALGQAFFSLSVATGVYITYGSYTRSQSSIPKNAAGVVVLDLVVAIMAGLIIFPAVFSYGIDPGRGPDLAFVTFPTIFADMPFGAIFALFFFFFVFVAALTSAISLLEVPVAFVKEKFAISRKLATPVTALIVTVFGVFCTLSFGPLAHIQIFDHTIFGLFDFLAAQVLLPFAGLLLSIFIGWVWKPAGVKTEIERENNSFPFFKTWSFLIKFIIPVVIFVIFLEAIGLI